MNFQEFSEKIPIVEARLGYTYKNRSLLTTALIHRSFLNEHKDVSSGHNERLEFLGDSILNLIVGEYLFQHLPATQEGTLSAIRASAVSSSACLSYMNQLHIQEYILVGKGEKMQAAKGRTSILADAFEALLGAIYLDGGLEAARHFFLSHFSSNIDQMCHTPQHNFKALLQEISQKEHRTMPEYRVLEESGPDHERLFVIGVFLHDTLFGTGTGPTKKEAEQQAAQIALNKLNRVEGQ